MVVIHEQACGTNLVGNFGPWLAMACLALVWLALASRAMAGQSVAGKATDENQQKGAWIAMVNHYESS